MLFLFILLLFPLFNHQLMFSLIQPNINCIALNFNIMCRKKWRDQWGLKRIQESTNKNNKPTKNNKHFWILLSFSSKNEVVTIVNAFLLFIAYHLFMMSCTCFPMYQYDMSNLILSLCLNHFNDSSSCNIILPLLNALFEQYFVFFVNNCCLTPLSYNSSYCFLHPISFTSFHLQCFKPLLNWLLTPIMKQIN